MQLSVDYAQSSDEALLLWMTRQDTEALERLYERHGQIVYNLIVRIVGDAAIAEELLQDTFWQAWQKAGEYRGEGSVPAWLYRIARNKSFDTLRRSQARPRAVETSTESDEQALWSRLAAGSGEVDAAIERHWDRQHVYAALNSLPPEQRHCLELAYFEGLSQRQIAERTGTPLGTVKTRVRMGLEKLERLLRAAGYQPEDG
ncbi:MAG TPA: sigma-70 family RNA polymerase sigma factor [Ardenticatenaceae bacterium]|nr:sigma-70 family RNA polymerase sigma factor [Ardenticatenaceae bacterium]